MVMSQTLTLPPQSQALPPIINHQSLSIQPPPPPVSDNGFPMLAIAILGITAVGFLLVSYYIFVTKCCFRWQQLDPLRRFRIRQNPLNNEDPLTSYSPSSWQSRGLNELLIRELPTFQYSKNEGEISSLSKCVVCLNEFQDHDMLRVLPKCSHGFHLDCIDVWLQNNSNCPLCRSTISGRNRYQPEQILAPNSSPQDRPPLVGSIVGGDEDFVVIELIEEDGTSMNSIEQERADSRRFLVQQPRSHSSRKFEQKILISKQRKSHHVSIMGDEGINVREKDDQFSFQPIRRSFSMDSAVDRHVYSSVQEILQQNRQHVDEVRSNGESSSRSRRPMFSFGQGRGSKNSVLPIEF